MAVGVRPIPPFRALQGVLGARIWIERPWYAPADLRGHYTALKPVTRVAIATRVYVPQRLNFRE